VIYRFTIQPTRVLSVRRVDDGWLVWIGGAPETVHHTYLYMHDDGAIERVTEGPDVIDVLKVKPPERSED
jgi:hypothetical protein